MAKRFFMATGVCVAFSAAALYAQTPAAAPAFEVASIKPVDMPGPAQAASGKIHVGMKIDAARVDIGLFSLTDLICKAYDVKKYQVSGPEWLGSQRFDVIAKMPEGATKDQVPQMLQALLAERFKLVVHKEKKEQSVYALVVAKGGAKMKESDPLPGAAPAAPTEAGGPPAPGGPAAPPASTGSSEVTFKAGAGGAVVNDGKGGQQKVSMVDGKIHIENSRASMTEFAEGLSGMVDRPVVDQTELKGFYQMTLELSVQDMMNAARKAGVNIPNAPAAGGGADAGRPADAAGDSTPNSIFASLQNLGLKLEPRKLPIDLIVVDKAEKMPTDN
jgi:uncharacterized protein (TIGR03435 family)